MKSLVKGQMFIIIYILSVFIVSILVQRSVKYNELNRILSLSLNQTQRVLLDKRYEINNNEEYLSEFYYLLCKNAHYCKDFNIDVYGIDYQLGLLDVEVSTSLFYPLDYKGKIKIRKTTIVDKEEEDGIRDE